MTIFIHIQQYVLGMYEKVIHIYKLTASLKYEQSTNEGQNKT
jgi:hypothetical protein